jgi:hypothetical protein
LVQEDNKKVSCFERVTAYGTGDGFDDGLFQVSDAKKLRQEMTLAVAAAETTLNKVGTSSRREHGLDVHGMGMSHKSVIRQVLHPDRLKEVACLALHCASALSMLGVRGFLPVYRIMCSGDDNGQGTRTVRGREWLDALYSYTPLRLWLIAAGAVDRGWCGCN